MKSPNWLTSALTAIALTATPTAALAQEGEAPAPSVVLENIVLGDVVLGDADAPITIVEYASLTCPHCAHFHESVMPVIEERIELGEVKFIFREFPTAPVQIAMAGFAIARCAGEEGYYPTLDTIFTGQDEMMVAARGGTVGEWLEGVAAGAGLSEPEFRACLADEELFNSMVATIEAGQDAGVRATPTVFMNGELLGNDAQTGAGMAALIDAALAAE